MIAGLLLARAGVDVLVLEKHADFLRDFRGDTIHPSSLQLLADLGLAEEFAQLPANHVTGVEFPSEDGTSVRLVDFSRLRHPYPYIAFAPQWEFLDLLARAGEREPRFTLLTEVEATGLVRGAPGGEDASTGGATAGTIVPADQVTGITYRDHRTGGTGTITARLTIAADGRTSVLREDAGLPMIDIPVGFDVWWFRIPARNADGTPIEVGETLLPRSSPDGSLFILIPRGDYVQAGMLIPKGSDAARRAEGIEVLRSRVASAVPDLAGALDSLTLEDVKLLNVAANRARRWWVRGFLAIGDAAHAMSPVGGVGVNLAVQDGAAAANALAEPLRTGTVRDSDLARLQRRRMVPTVLTQAAQRGPAALISEALSAGTGLALPRRVAEVFRRVPALSAVPAYLVGVGVRPERVRPARAHRARTRR
ncbi:FAD-dependent oxidoreductase [Brevibacterium samyangense]|uniref:FAD-dependent oxidoreductase n=2 Tax=Brevibacterium samyangense TaxID=366888 RepID=A0ABP5EFQ1_9MICO